ncbi:unnamed protein product [Clonostachys solani]|uniref:Uncharacterized protein n=1 Tax=Clonostachys solani TaxID=160281 RepID=A0A9P0ELL8_9HYPO|nr:unnamed protein product [Clonostachys solani]
MAPTVRLPPDLDLEYSNLDLEYLDKSNINSVFNNNSYKGSIYRSDKTILEESPNNKEVDFKDTINLFSSIRLLIITLKDLAKKYILSNKK